MKKASKAHTVSKSKQLIMNTLFGAGVGMVSMLGCLALFSVICAAIPDPHPLVTPLCFFAIYASAFFAGLAAVKRNGGRDALIYGSLCGVVYMLIIWLAFAALGKAFGVESKQTSAFIWKLCMLPAAVVGGFSGLKGNRPKKAKRKF